MSFREYNYKKNRLIDRRDRGVISDSEYQIKKSKLFI